FEKVALASGETKRVTLRVPVSDLGFHLDDGSYLIEEGAIQVFMGGHSNADRIGEARINETVRRPLADSRAGLSTGAAQ
ncbi:MAG: fibronectin type III-like domain-contianing protein, partial [Microvirga sp.]